MGLRICYGFVAFFAFVLWGIKQEEDATLGQILAMAVVVAVAAATFPGAFWTAALDHS